MHAGHRQSSRTDCHQNIDGVGGSVFGLEARLVLVHLLDGDGSIRDAALNVLMKYAFHRARSSFDNALPALPSYSFPSGHAAGATLFYGVLAAMLVSKIDAWRPRVIIILTAIALILLVALSRVYLGVHYLSDVLGGFAEAMAWLTLCLLGIHTYWQHHVASQSMK